MMTSTLIRSHEEQRRCTMKVEKAVEHCLEYHKANSQKKYARRV